MLRPPHAEGGIGAIRVELRGRVGVERRVAVYGAIERPAVAAGAVAAAATMDAAALMAALDAAELSDYAPPLCERLEELTSAAS